MWHANMKPVQTLECFPLIKFLDRKSDDVAGFSFGFFPKTLNETTGGRKSRNERQARICFRCISLYIFEDEYSDLSD